MHLCAFVSMGVCACVCGCMCPGDVRGGLQTDKKEYRVSRKKSTCGGVYVISIYKISIVGQDRVVPALKTQNTALKTQNNNSKSYLKHKPNLDLDKCVGFVA